MLASPSPHIPSLEGATQRIHDLMYVFCVNLLILYHIFLQKGLYLIIIKAICLLVKRFKQYKM
jgi:hypothetical protein